VLFYYFYFIYFFDFWVVFGKIEINPQCEKNIKEIEQILTNEPHNIEIFKLTEGETLYSFVSFFKNIHELGALKFKSNTDLCVDYTKIIEMSYVPIENILKCSFSTIFKKCIEDLGVRDEKFNF